MVVKVYPLRYEKSHLCASRQRRRARNPGGGIAPSTDAFTLRRCQILLASSRGENAYQIARSLGCNPQTARNAIHAFNEKGLPEALRQLRQGSKRPRTVHRAFQGPQRAEALRELLHHKKPREYRKVTSLWTLDLAAEVGFEEGLTEERITGETASGRRWRGWG